MSKYILDKEKFLKELKQRFEENPDEQLNWVWEKLLAKHTIPLEEDRGECVCSHDDNSCCVGCEPHPRSMRKPTPEPCEHIWNTHSGSKGSWEQCRVCNEVKEPTPEPEECKHDTEGLVCLHCGKDFNRKPKSKVPEPFDTTGGATAYEYKINEILTYLKEKEDL